MKRTSQSLASIARQVVGVLASAYAILSAQSVAPHLPAAVLLPLAAAGPIILAVEHYVSDPSTGNATAVVDAVQAVPEAAKIEVLVRAELAKILGLDAPAAAATVAAATAKPIPAK